MLTIIWKKRQKKINPEKDKKAAPERDTIILCSGSMDARRGGGTPRDGLGGGRGCLDTLEVRGGVLGHLGSPEN
jgi:hypothetical protein